MGGAEIAYRVKNSVRARLEAKGIGLAKPKQTPLHQSASPSWLSDTCMMSNANAYISAADAVLAGRFNIFAMNGAELGFPPDWNRDPRTGIKAPLVFGKTLDYRNSKVVGDIKYLWEPNRHLELVTLAQAWNLTGENRYASGCQTLLESWFEQCPYPLGVNWTSSLEHSVRLMNWSVVWHLLGGEQCLLFQGKEGVAFRQCWLDSVYQHCHFIAGHFSRFSSANNHLFGEYMGLFVGSLTWPCWKECNGWQKLAKTGLEKEALLQNADDGVNREQGIWYHHEVADMMLLCGLIGRTNKIVFSGSYWQRLESMFDFIASIMDMGGNVPMIGDSDDAVMVRFSQEPDFNVYRSLLATGAVLFNRPDFKVVAGSFDDKSRWLLGDAGADCFEALPENSEAPSFLREFPAGGYWVLGSGFQTSQEIKLVVDAGPLGYLSIAAHGHADALAFTLTAGGNEILVDPGTFAYHTQKIWRDYFRGTSAHNTVRIDCFDQSEITGNFMWSNHATAICELFTTTPDGDVFVGVHDGYRRLKDPVLHRREIAFNKLESSITVSDHLACQSVHDIEIFWHFSELCEVTVIGSEVIARNGAAVVCMSMLTGQLLPRLERGNDNPPLGWVSRSFDEKIPANTVVWSGTINGSVSVQTAMKISYKI